MAHALNHEERIAWRNIVDAALRAPWADNRPALRFSWNAGAHALEWHTTEPAQWSALPHRRWLALLAVGAALENASLRAAADGHALRHERCGASASTLIARSTLQCNVAPDAQDPSLASFIDARCTNRRFYRRQALPQTTLQSIASAAGPHLFWLDNAAARRTAQHMLRIAEAERFSQWRLHNELFDAIRFDVGWQKSAAHGLPPAALEIEAPMRWPFALLRRARVARLCAALRVPKLLAWRAVGLPCALAPQLALIATTRDAGDDTACSLAAGRALQRAWLAAAREGLALQPFAACGALLRQAPGDGWVRAATQQRLQRSSAALSRQLGYERIHDVQIFLRIGKAAPPSARAGREDGARLLPSALRDPPE